MKLTKKADTNIFKIASLIKPEISKLTTYDEAWEIIANHYDMEFDVFKSQRLGTIVNIYKGNEDIPVGTIKYDNDKIFNDANGDFEWTTIYKDVINYIIDNKIIKKPRAKRKDAGKTKNKAI